MTSTINGLVLLRGCQIQPVQVRFDRLILAGYTSRELADVTRHIEELAALGIPPPESIPELYPGILSIQVDGRIDGGAGRSSGEVEYVLCVSSSRVLVGVGSDHTDRDMQKTSAVLAKQAFPKVIGPYLRSLTELEPIWDSLRLRSWLSADGERMLYQEGPVSSIMPPRELMAKVPIRADEGTVIIFSGTVPIVHSPPDDGVWSFTGEILDDQGRILCHCRYEYDASPAQGLG